MVNGDVSIRTYCKTIDVWAFWSHQLVYGVHLNQLYCREENSVAGSEKCAVSLNVADYRNGRRRLCPRITVVVGIVAVPLILLT